MSNIFRHRAPALLSLATVLLASSPCLADWSALNKDYGGGLNMKLYTPSKPAASPAILVSIHFCSGNADSAKSWFTSDADKNGFYIIAPDAGANCFDSSATRSGDRADIVKMVQYVITQKNADKNRVFAAGFSSGGCMTNTLLGIYPDVFAGGAAMPGYPVGIWPANDHMCTQCMNNNVPTKTPQQWGDMARTAFAFTGTRPCVQEWVGGGDQYSFNEYFPAVATQFSNLMDLGSGSPGTGAPSGWTRTVYKDTAGNVRLEMNLGPSGQAHDLTGAGLFSYVISFLGLDKPTGACGMATSGSSGGAGAGGGASTGTGGGTSSGGAPSSAGGTTASGGTGTVSTGGSTTTGTGGSATTGGSSSTGSGGATGSVAIGGATAGGVPAQPGGAVGSSSNSDSSGCSISAAGTASSRSGLLAMLSLAAISVGVARRRKRSA